MWCSDDTTWDTLHPIIGHLGSPGSAYTQAWEAAVEGQVQKSMLSAGDKVESEPVDGRAVSSLLKHIEIFLENVKREIKPQNLSRTEELIRTHYKYAVTEKLPATLFSRRRIKIISYKTPNIDTRAQHT